jgi:hypothetical protein
MKGLKNIGMLLVSIWFILGGLRGLLSLGFLHLNLLMNILALAGGALLLWSLVTDKAASA